MINLFRDLFQVLLPLLVTAGTLPLLDKNPRRVRAFGVALLVFAVLCVPLLMIELSSAGGKVWLAALRMVSCLLGGVYLLVRVHLSRREVDQ
ncbi:MULTISPECIES: hypothetical protein [unclassified Mycobacterium]|uniref:hypothetical protein n=1 Tax=unclassified Mycobacterium TaxID=2642494 RepID=UPI000A9263B4|nr:MULTISPECIES: hypothetical protein [unclassified Mycobacterium]